MNVKVFKMRDERGEKPDAYFEKLNIHSINCVAQFFNFLCYLYLQVLAEEMLKLEKDRKMNYHIFSGFRKNISPIKQDSFKQKTV